jgi:nucleoside-diphosphate-sugar epimerase
VTGARVLVVGASGFLGRHLCPRLRDAGAEIHAVSRRRAHAHPSAERWWTADVADEVSTRALVRAVKPDIAVHLGALTNAAPDLALVVPTFRSALASTVNLLAALTEQGCRRIVLAGSIEEPVGDATVVQPASPYAAAKWAASAYARMFHALYQAPVVVARLTLAYGPDQLERKVIPSTILALLRGQRPRVTSGTRFWDLIYVDDAVEALVRLAEGRAPDGATVDIGTGRLTTLRSVVEHLAAIVDPTMVPAFGAVADRPLTESRAADAAATAAMLGWRATTSLEAGLRRTVEWYRAHTAWSRHHGRTYEGGAVLRWGRRTA